MEPFTTLTSRVARLPEADVDTDIIFPARFLLITEKRGLGRYAFFEKRVEGDDFPLGAAENPPGILIAGDNFGCGSSREQAVWALCDLGLRSILSTSFGEIFQSNCFKNGVLPIVLSADDLASLSDDTELTVDLLECRIHSNGGRSLAFEIPDWRRQSLLNGWDEVLTLLNTEAAAITSFEASRRAVAPWLFTAE